MDPNLVGIKRVYTRKPGEMVPDPTIQAVDPAGSEIVVEWEAGSTANAAALPTPLNLEILTRDITNAVGTPLVGGASLTPAVAVASDGENRPGTYEYVLPVGGGTYVGGNTYETTACLSRPNDTVCFSEWKFMAY